MPNPEQIAEVLGKVLGPVDKALSAPGRAYHRAALGPEREQEMFDYERNSPYGRLVTAGQILAGVPQVASALPGSVSRAASTTKAASVPFDPSRRAFLGAAGKAAGAAAAGMSAAKIAGKIGKKSTPSLKSFGGKLGGEQHFVWPMEVKGNVQGQLKTTGFELWEFDDTGAAVRQYSEKVHRTEPNNTFDAFESAQAEANAVNELHGTFTIFDDYDNRTPYLVRESEQ